jgi:uncharacterized protein (UPF0262 family)
METTDHKKTPYRIADDLLAFIAPSLEGEQAMAVATVVHELARDYVQVRKALRSDYESLASSAKREIETIDNGKRPYNWVASTANSISENHGKLQSLEDALRCQQFMLETVYKIESVGGIDIFQYLND